MDRDNFNDELHMDDDGEMVGGRTHFCAQVPEREYAPMCATSTPLARSQERDFHRRQLFWEWTEEYLPVPGGGDVDEGGTPYGEQIWSSDLDTHCVMLWLQTLDDVEHSNHYVYPPTCLRARCYLSPIFYDVGDLSRLVRPGDPEREFLPREIVYAAIHRGKGAEHPEYQYQQPPSARAMIEGLVVAPYLTDSDLFDEPYRSVFTSSSVQIEGRGLAMAQVPSTMLIVYGGAYADGTFEPGVWTGTVDEQAMTILWTGPMVPSPAPPARSDAVMLATRSPGGEVVVLGGRSSNGLLGDAWRYDVARSAWDELEPTLAGTVRLSGRARDLAVRRRYAYVAAGRAVEVVDLSDPAAPVVAGRVRLSDKPKAVALVGGSVLVASTRRGVAVVDVSDPGSPEEVAFLWLRSTRRGGWEAELDGGGRRPPWRDHCGGHGPRPLASEGPYVVMGVGQDLLVLDLSDPLDPDLAGGVRVRDRVRALRVHGGLVYVAAKPMRRDGAVVEINRPDIPVVSGEHSVVEWVRGAVSRAGWAYQRTPRGVVVAEVRTEP